MLNVHITRFFLLLFCSHLLLQCRPTDKSETGSGHSGFASEVVKLDLGEIKKRGHITAIMDNSSTGLFIYKGKTMGYEYELLQLFAQSHNLDLRINLTKSLEEGFRKLDSGEGDILAYNLTITRERKERIAFTHYHNQVKQMLIQRKPDNWRKMKLHEIERELVRSPVDLIGKKVHVRHHSSYFDRLQNLSNEIGGDILIIEDDPEMETEAIIRKVAEGTIDYTVAEEDIAMVNATYYPNLDVKTAISLPTQIAWGVRKNADSLLLALNKWIVKMRKTTDYYVIYDKYFKSTKSSLKRTQSKYFSISGYELSPYDSLIKSAAAELEWDWRLLAAQIFKESQFNPNAESWAGAIGLMQLLPVTADEYQISDFYDPVQNIQGGTLHLKWLSGYFEKLIEDQEEQKKFVLAAYNVGHGHVIDAINLTYKYGGDPEKWDDVKEYLVKKSNAKYYTDPVVRYGYCRGLEPLNYVNSILSVYENYLVMYPDERFIAEDL